jgi:hypothetical protein
MRNIILISCFCMFLSSICIGQSYTDVNVNFMVRGYIHASSSIKDTSAIGGFGPSNNYPKKIDELISSLGGGLFLKIDTSKLIVFAEKYNGYKLYLANKSDSIVSFDASDSRLSVVAEAFIDNRWQPIEYLPSSWCGNSYHTVYLNKMEYWEFGIPKYTGSKQTKIRYKLSINSMNIYSDEISASVNKKQLSEKQGHQPQGLMDPYND